MRLLLIFSICGLLQVQAEVCAPNMTWDDCWSICEPTCQSQVDNSPCYSICSSGCICNENYVLDKEGGVCVLESTCPDILKASDPTEEPETEAPAPEKPTEPPTEPKTPEAPLTEKPIIAPTPTPKAETPIEPQTEGPIIAPAPATEAPTEPPSETTVGVTEKKKKKKKCHV